MIHQIIKKNTKYHNTPVQKKKGRKLSVASPSIPAPTVFSQNLKLPCVPFSSLSFIFIMGIYHLFKNEIFFFFNN